jgi:hypothetical protein
VFIHSISSSLILGIVCLAIALYPVVLLGYAGQWWCRFVDIK